MNEDQITSRFNRQIILEEIGKEGQTQLLNSHVLVVGAGGLGCPLILYLAAAGIGKISIVDGDLISEENLHRQILFGYDDIGRNKAVVAAEKIKKLYPVAQVQYHEEFLDKNTAFSRIEKADIVVDGSDNFETRYLVSDAGVILGKPLVSGSIHKFEGQVSIFNDPPGLGPTYRCLYPFAPGKDAPPPCSVSGVIGPLPGVVGSVMAMETIKVLAGIKNRLSGTLLLINLLSHNYNKIKLDPDLKNYRGPKSWEEFLGYDYSSFCGTSSGEKIEVLHFENLNSVKGSYALIDVREEGEIPEIESGKVMRFPLSKILAGQIPEINSDNAIFFCQSGIRSGQALEKLSGKLKARMFALKEGAKKLQSLLG